MMRINSLSAAIMLFNNPLKWEVFVLVHFRKDDNNKIYITYFCSMNQKLFYLFALYLP